MKRIREKNLLESNMLFFVVLCKFGRFLTGVVFPAAVILLLQPAGCSVKFGSGGESCGDGVLEGDELCDGSDFGGQTCSDWTVYEEGELLCNDDCTLNFSSCHTCGNGTVEGPEECDGEKLKNKTCATFGFEGGDIACLPDCSGFDISGCTSGEECGNDMVEGDEVCDGLDLREETCESQGFDGGGDLACLSDCSGFDTSGCIFGEVCGNGVAEDGEVCDGVDLKGETCKSMGFDSGTLSCLQDCSNYDVSGCSRIDAVGGEVSYYEEQGTIYRIHTFKSDGELEVIEGGELEYLIVAGGGGGGLGNDSPDGGGGGGAGGVLYGTLGVSSGDYPIIVGNGGVGGTCNPTCGESGQGANGGDSSFSGLIAIGGGGGGGTEGAVREGGDGGSGGGSARNQDPGVGTVGQGNDGAVGDLDPDGVTQSYHGGGGGGAGSVGGISDDGRSAGDGVAINITGAELTYATGGRGGDASGTEAGADALDGRGDGGDGGDGDTGSGISGGDGGDGIVIVRYRVSEMP